MATFFERYALLCKQHGESTTAMGTELGFAKATISAWRNGTKEPGSKSIKRLSAYFDVSADYLLGKSDIRNPDKELTQEEKVKIAVFGTEEVPQKAWVEFERVVEHLKRKYAIGSDNKGKKR